MSEIQQLPSTDHAVHDRVSAQADELAKQRRKRNAPGSSISYADSRVNVHMNESTGIVFMGLLALMLLVALLRAQADYRKLAQGLLQPPA